MTALARKLALASCLLACAAGSWAQPVSEAAVKAALLYRFAAYVEWPATVAGQASEPLVFGVMGSDEIAGELERVLAGRAIHGRGTTVKRLKEGDPLEGVHLLYVGRRVANPREVHRVARRHGALTVGEHGLGTGSAVEFVVAEDRVTFEVSLDAVERGGHHISSRMLAVARRVVPKGTP